MILLYGSDSKTKSKLNDIASAKAWQTQANPQKCELLQFFTGFSSIILLIYILDFGT